MLLYLIFLFVQKPVQKGLGILFCIRFLQILSFRFIVSLSYFIISLLCFIFMFIKSLWSAMILVSIQLVAIFTLNVSIIVFLVCFIFILIVCTIIMLLFQCLAISIRIFVYFIFAMLKKFLEVANIVILFQNLVLHSFQYQHTIWQCSVNGIRTSIYKTDTFYLPFYLRVLE